MMHTVNSQNPRYLYNPRDLRNPTSIRETPQEKKERQDNELAPYIDLSNREGFKEVSEMKPAKDYFSQGTLGLDGRIGHILFTLELFQDYPAEITSNIKDTTKKNMLVKESEKHLDKNLIAYTREDAMYIVIKLKTALESPPRYFLDMDVDGKNVKVCYEGNNLTGTHKDRLSMFTLKNYYIPLIENQLKDPNEEFVLLPVISTLSSGSGIYSLSTYCDIFGLPQPHSIVDSHIDKSYLYELCTNRSAFYPMSLNSFIETTQVQTVTENPGGFDLINAEEINGNPMSEAYEELARTVLNENPDFVFVPFGSGSLFNTLLTYAEGYDHKVSIIAVKSAQEQSALSKLDHLGTEHPAQSFKDDYANTGDYTDVIGITDYEFLDAQIKYDEVRLPTEPSGSASLAGYMQIKQTLNGEGQPIISDRDKVIVVNTGKCKVNKPKYSASTVFRQSMPPLIDGSRQGFLADKSLELTEKTKHLVDKCLKNLCGIAELP
jgi:hypothetical protein